MDKIRIYTVAQELGVPAKELLAFFEENGQSFSSHLALLDEASADRARAYFATQADQVETVLAPALAASRTSDTPVLDFAPFQVETPAKSQPEWHQDEHLYAASQEAVAKVEQKVTADAQAPIRHSLVTSAVATASVAVAPTFVAFATFVFGNPNPRPLLAVLLSIILTAAAIVAGSAVWSTQPESAGFSFGDLMLWSWVRREAAERALIENTAVLGFDRFGRFLGNSTASQEDQMRAVREIAAALDAKSSYTLGHSRRVEKHVRKVAEAMGLSAEEIADLATAAALHDIGNIQIPDAVLRKAGELTIEERDAIEAHVLLGARMVLKAGNGNVVDGIRHHHERWDGAGYPDGLSGSDIPLFARLIGIAEAYDAMTSTRPYRQGFGRDHAVEVLRAESGLQFDGELVELFVSTLPEPLAIIKKFPFLGRVQQQVHELQLLFKRMGAVAVSATASTIAIALILGGTVLSPGTSDAPELADKNRKVTPIDRVLASRLQNEAGYDSAAPLSTVLSPRESAMALSRVAEEDDSALVAALDGDEVKIPGDEGPGQGGPGQGGGTDVPGNGNPGNGNAGPGNGGPGEDGSVGSGPVTDEGPVIDADPSDRGPGSSGSPSETPPPPSYDAPGNSENAPGQNKDGGRPGNSANAPGHNKDDGAAPGNSGNAPGQNKDDGTAPGNSGNAPGQNKDDGAAPGNSNAGGNSGGGSTGAPGNSGNSNAGGNSGGGSTDAPGNSGNSNAGGNGGAGVGAGAGATAAPGNSGDRSDTPAADSSPGNSANSNGNGKN